MGGTGSEQGADAGAQGPARQVVEGDHAVDHVRQGPGQGGLHRVGAEGPALEAVVQDQGAEGLLHLLHVAAEQDGGAPGGHFLHGEAPVPEPPHHGVKVLPGGAELRAEGLGREPAVVVGGGGILEAFQQGVHAGLGLGGQAQGQEHPLHGRGGVGAAHGLGLGHGGMHVALEHHPVPVVHWSHGEHGEGQRCGQNGQSA